MGEEDNLLAEQVVRKKVNSKIGFFPEECSNEF